MLDNKRIGLFATGCLVSDCVEGSLDAVDGEPGIIGVIDTHPTEANCLQSSLQIHINSKSFSNLMMHKRNS